MRSWLRQAVFEQPETAANTRILTTNQKVAGSSPAERSPWDVWLPDPSHGEPVPATWVHPFARTCITVLAEHASGVRRGTHLSGPDRQDVPLQLVDVVK